MTILRKKMEIQSTLSNSEFASACGCVEVEESSVRSINRNADTLKTMQNTSGLSVKITGPKSIEG